MKEKHLLVLFVKQHMFQFQNLIYFFQSMQKVQKDFVYYCYLLQYDNKLFLVVGLVDKLKCINVAMKVIHSYFFTFNFKTFNVL
jgi:hypothetical protein